MGATGVLGRSWLIQTANLKSISRDAKFCLRAHDLLFAITRNIRNPLQV